MTPCVANPIYDSVFKFLMEDERIARALLSSLLKKDIVSVEMRPNEYSNQEEKRVSVFRIDFGARVREADGSEHLIVVELQKTWRPTEMMRFRQYLGVQYENKRNVDANGTPLPIVSIYLLGHKVGDIKEPVVYISRRYLDYDSQEITEGVPDPFVESLTHDSIIVQIPYLTSKAKNYLEQLLCFFDQAFVMDNPHLITLEGRDISEDDPILQRIANRLASAAAIPEIRHTMNVEDEIFSELEELDTKVLMQKKQLEEKDTQLAQQGEQLAQQGEQLAASIRLMLSNGIPKALVAEALGISVTDIDAFNA